MRLGAMSSILVSIIVTPIWVKTSSPIQTASALPGTSRAPIPYPIDCRDIARDDGASQISQTPLDSVAGLNDDPLAARVPALLVPHLDADLVAKAKRLDGGVKEVAIGAGVDQRTKRHVPGDAREAIEIRDGHARVLLMWTAAASMGDMLAGRLATRTVTALTFGKASTPWAIRVARVSISFTDSPSMVCLAIARICL